MDFIILVFTFGLSDFLVVGLSTCRTLFVKFWSVPNICWPLVKYFDSKNKTIWGLFSHLTGYTSTVLDNYVQRGIQHFLSGNGRFVVKLESPAFYFFEIVCVCVCVRVCGEIENSEWCDICSKLFFRENFLSSFWKWTCFTINKITQNCSYCVLRIVNAIFSSGSFRKFSVHISQFDV